MKVSSELATPPQVLTSSRITNKIVVCHKQVVECGGHVPLFVVRVNPLCGCVGACVVSC